MGSEGPNWSSVHVHYHGGDFTELLRIGVTRLFADDRLPRGYFLPHWRGGRHVRLNFNCSVDDARTYVVPVVDEHITPFLQRHPSPGHGIDPTRRERHARLRILEQDFDDCSDGFDNSVLVKPYADRLHLYKHEAAQVCMQDFYCSTNRSALSAVAAGAHDRRVLLAHAFDVLAAGVHFASPVGAIQHSFISFRSHSDGFLYSWPEGLGRKASWDEHYNVAAPALRARLERLLAEGRSALTADVRGVVGDLEARRPLVQQLWADGYLADMIGVASKPEMLSQFVPGLTERSTFHRNLLSHPDWEATRVSERFEVHRVLLNYMYCHLTRIGIRPVERFLLCFLVAKSVEELFDVDAAALVTG